VVGDNRAARLVGWELGRFCDVLGGDRGTDEVVAVDMPVGLLASGRRSCDLAGRRALGRAAARVFLVPPRYAFEAPDLEATNDVLRSNGEPGVSAQTYALRSAVMEVDAHAHDPRVFEVHPELAFLALAGRVLTSKHTAAGVDERVDALARWIDVAAAVAATPARVAVHDALDALVAAWTATRIRSGHAVLYAPDAAGGSPAIRA
jgi:predicted RNase H-like nuclease